MLGLASLVLLPTAPSQAESTEIEPVVVTATRTARTVDQSLAAVSVITREDIERRQARNLGDVLRALPGMQMTNNGGEGQATSMFLRGTESDHVLVLIDGQRVGSSTLGTAPFQDLPLHHIDRIEVVRGPRSSLYGAEAIGGVIQIFTRKGDKGGKSFSGTIGSDDTGIISGTYALGDQDRWLTVGLSLKETDGFDACQADLTAGCFANEPDEDGYRNQSFSLRGGFRMGESTEFDLQVLQANGDTEFDGGFTNESDTRSQVVGGKVKTWLSDSWQMTLAAGRADDESDNFLNGAFASRFDTQRDNYSAQSDWYVGEDTLLTLGLDHEDVSVESSTAYTVSERANSGLFTQYQGRIGEHDIQLAMRADDNEQFGSHRTGSIAWGHSLDNGLRLNASFGTAYKTPTFNDLYFPLFGNPNLDPERSRSLEFGVNGSHFDTAWSVHVYETRIKDLIAFDPFFVPANIAKARIQGLELAASREIMGWTVSARADFMDPVNQSAGANQGKLLNRRPNQILNVDVDRGFGDWSVGASLNMVGRRFDDLPNNNELGGYSVLDLRVEKSLDKHWTLQGRVDNAFDERYETARRFNQPERGYYLTLRYSDF